MSLRHTTDTLTGTRDENLECKACDRRECRFSTQAQGLHSSLFSKENSVDGQDLRFNRK